MDVPTFRSLENVKWAYSLQADPPPTTITMIRREAEIGVVSSFVPT